MSVLALTLARSGSRGLPGKNLRMIAGRRCVEWTLRAALAARDAGAVTRVALSADGAELLEAARGLGVETVERPAELAGDTARVDDAARHAVRALEAGGAAVERIVILYGNVPVRPAGLIERAAALLAESGADSVQSYEPVGKHHPWWTAVVEPGARVRPWEGEVLNHGVFRRQDLPPAHVPDGGVLAVTRRALFLEVPGCGAGPHAFLGRERRGIVNEIGSVVDIDTEIDALVAQAVLSGRGEGAACRC
ncbi:MAG: hypothetical protein SFZ24_11770 [Planctomycetota bacterium]|nr:hypothetical protein [Planctomycetota bacterium]